METENTENTQNKEESIEGSSGDEALKENLRLQKTIYIKQQLERRRAAEDARLEQLLREQEIIDSLRESVDDSVWQTEEARKYNREFQERVNMQIYEANGITEDKLTGIKEYENAIYRGGAAVLFFLSLVLIVLCGLLHGFRSGVCLLMFAYTAMQGALLSQENKRLPLLDFICRVFYIMTFPTMLAMFVCYELRSEVYEFFLDYAAILGVLVTVLSTLSYFLYDPYSQDKRKMREAQNQIREIERLAGKEVRKNQKLREKEERKAQKLLAREQQENQPGMEITGFFARFKKSDKQNEESSV